MDKPRICEVLGVEVREVFTADTPYGQFKRCVVDEEGQILNTGINVLCYIINHPDRIIRKPRWTEQEVEDAKTLKRLFGKYPIVEFGARHVFGGLRLNEDAFPSIRPGETVTLDEIIGGGAHA